MTDRNEYQLHQHCDGATWQQMLAKREVSKIVRMEDAALRAEFPARAGIWDYCAIAIGSLAMVILRIKGGF